MSDEKICPRCAETVKAAAAVCKHCGHEFGTPQNVGPIPPLKTSPAKKALGIGCLGLIVLFIIGLVITPNPNAPSNDVEAPAADASPPVAVSARDLGAAYEANEMAAQQKYGGHTLAVTGIVTSVDLDLSDDPVVMLQGANEFSSVHANFTKAEADATAALNKGQTVTVICSKLSEVMGSPILKDCRFQ